MYLARQDHVNTRKVFSNIIQPIVAENLMGYGLARYYLWALMTSHYTLEILKDRYTTIFFEVLVNNQEYSEFLAFFEQKELLGLNKYFIY